MSLPTWTLKRSAKSSLQRSLSDDALRRLIRKVSVSGLELVKAPLGSEWVPLHTLPLFREEATGGRAAPDTATLARARSKSMRGFIGLMALAGALGALTGVVALAGAPDPAIAGLGAVAMSMVAAGWVARMLVAIRHGGRTPARARTPNVQPVHDELESAVAALEAALASAPPSVRHAVHLPTVKQVVDATRRKRVLLRSLHTPQDPRPDLLTELATAKECAAKATDPGAADAFADEIRSIEGLLESLDRWMKAASEADARERALVNEIEALRHAIVRTSVAGTSEDEMIDRLASVRRTLEEESAIERDLTRGVRTLGPVKA